MNKSNQNCKVKWTTDSTAIKTKWEQTNTINNNNDGKLNQDKNEKSIV